MQAVWEMKDVPIGLTLVAFAILAETIVVTVAQPFRKRFDVGTFDEALKLEASVIANDVLTQNQRLMLKGELPACSSGVQCECRQNSPLHTGRIFNSFCGFILHK
jgi:hypothetical protein